MPYQAFKILALSTFLVWWQCGVSPAQESGTSAIVADWKARASSVQTVRGELEYESASLKAGSGPNGRDKQRGATKGRAAFKINFQTGCFRLDIEIDPSSNSDTSAKQVKTKAFSGVDYRSVVHPASKGETNVKPYGPTAADMLVVKSGFDQYPIDQMLVPIIEHCGRIGQSQDQQLYPGTFQVQDIAPLVEILIPKSRTDVSSGALLFEAFPSKVGSQSSSLTLGFHPKLQHRLLSQEIRLGRRPLLSRTFRYEREELAGWRVVSYLPASDEVVLDQTVQVKRIEYNTRIADTEFVVNPSPGMVLGEVTQNATQTEPGHLRSEQIARFQVGDDGTFTPLDPVPKGTTSRLVLGCLAVTVVGVFILLCWQWVRRKSK